MGTQEHVRCVVGWLVEIDNGDHPYESRMTMDYQRHAHSRVSPGTPVGIVLVSVPRGD